MSHNESPGSGHARSRQADGASSEDGTSGRRAPADSGEQSDDSRSDGGADAAQPDNSGSGGDSATRAETSSESATQGEQSAPRRRRDPIRVVTGTVLALCTVIFVWYVLADRHTPYTDQARVRSLLVPIVPRVSGNVTHIGVSLHSVVEEGDTLFQLDRRPFLLAVRSAEANVDNTAQQVGAQTATVKSAAARLGSARAQLDRAQRNYDRTRRVLDENPGALSQADWDRTETSLAQAVERVASAEADLERAQQQLGTSGANNAQLRAALVALEKAQLDLEYATLLAPSMGAIESFNVDLGHYAAAGQPLATFMSVADVWIEADFRENNLAHIKAGDPVEFALDVAPGEVFQGTVRSVGFGVSSGETTNRGALPSVSGSKGWLRDPQRFPVIVALGSTELVGLRRAGGQCDVVVYTGDHPFLNAIGRLQIRLRSWFSYVR